MCIHNSQLSEIALFVAKIFGWNVLAHLILHFYSGHHVTIPQKFNSWKVDSFKQFSKLQKIISAFSLNDLEISNLRKWEICVNVYDVFKILWWSNNYLIYYNYIELLNPVPSFYQFQLICLLEMEKKRTKDCECNTLWLIIPTLALVIITKYCLLW